MIFVRPSGGGGGWKAFASGFMVFDISLWRLLSKIVSGRCTYGQRALIVVFDGNDKAGGLLFWRMLG